MTCDTYDCSAAATRVVRWAESSGMFCEECARRLWLFGDAVEPSFERAPVIPFPERR